MTVQDMLLADHWQQSYEDSVKVVARMTNKLDEYKKKPDANEKYIQAAQYNIDTLEKFLEITAQLLEKQADMIREANKLKPRLKYVEEQHELLTMYAQSKGCDISLLPFLTRKDFY